VEISLDDFYFIWLLYMFLIGIHSLNVYIVFVILTKLFVLPKMSMKLQGLVL
jgi:hypothetical protein